MVSVQGLSSFLVNHAADKGFETVKVWVYFKKKTVRSPNEIDFVGEENESTEIVYIKKLHYSHVMFC